MASGITPTKYGLRDAEWASYVELATGSTAQRMVGELSIGSVDIQIGAVEIKGSSNDYRVDVQLDNGSLVGSPMFMPVGGIYNSTPPTYANGDAAVIQVNSSGRILADNIGSVAITNFPVLGSSVVVTNFSDLGSNITGSVTITNFNALGSSVVITNFSDIGSSVVVENFSDLGSNIVVTNFSDLGSNITGSVAITNFSDLGSNVVVSNFSDLGSDVVVTNYTGSTVVSNYTGSVYSYIGSQANLYTIVCGTSGTSIIPLKCTSDGYLITSGVA